MPLFRTSLHEESGIRVTILTDSQLNSVNPQSAVFSNPLNVSQKSVIRTLFEAKSVRAVNLFTPSLRPAREWTSLFIPWRHGLTWPDFFGGMKIVAHSPEEFSLCQAVLCLLQGLNYTVHPWRSQAKPDEILEITVCHPANRTVNLPLLVVENWWSQ